MAGFFFSFVSGRTDLSGRYNSRQNLVQFFRFCVIDRNNKASSAFKGNSHNDETAFFDCLHGSVTGSRLHSRHLRHLFLAKRVFIIPRVNEPKNHG